jgi:hypothetical protein
VLVKKGEEGRGLLAFEVGELGQSLDQKKQQSRVTPVNEPRGDNEGSSDDFSDRSPVCVCNYTPPRIDSTADHRPDRVLTS